jgi:hypothetical protein
MNIAFHRPSMVWLASFPFSGDNCMAAASLVSFRSLWGEQDTLFSALAHGSVQEAHAMVGDELRGAALLVDDEGEQRSRDGKGGCQ